MKKKKKVRSKKAPKKKSDIQSDFLRLERADYCFDKGLKSWDNGRLQKALLYFKKALKAYPDDESVGRALVDLGREMGKDDVVLYGYSHLFRLGELGIESYSEFINLLIDDQKYQRALKILEEYRFLIADFGLPAKKKNSHLKQIIGIEEYCRKLLEEQKAGLKKPGLRKEGGKEEKNSTVPEKDESGQESPPQEAETKQEESPPAIPVTLEFDSGSFHSILSEKKFMPPEVLEATIEAYRIRFRNSFENLICLPLLPGIESFWYQEETVRKVLRTFRGRAMLADEVGLGKTIEAGMVLREYIERGMVQNALILTPTPLVSQWKEELRVKFGLDFFSTDDPGIKINREFWQASFVLASINHAKSRKNFSEVTEREYDMVIVDEAHHLKNKNTLNWKLVNSLKKRFLLFLTATPVENNLMELYNLITLLKPGLLKTSSEFKNEFVTRGDSVSPRNRERLKGLLDRVMIRNTRALAAINIPPRYARTVRVVPDPGELRLYETITSLVSRIRQSGRLRKRLLLKNLLGEAGSSPRA
ncbi:MAG: SNF2-related protein, partial [Thermodesulfobacteriota bacterium]